MSAVNFIWLLLAWRRLFERATQFRRTLDQSVGGDLIGRVRRQTRCMLSAFLVGVPVKSTGQTQLGFPARSASDPATLLSAAARSCGPPRFHDPGRAPRYLMGPAGRHRRAARGWAGRAGSPVRRPRGRSRWLRRCRARHAVGRPTRSQPISLAKSPFNPSRLIGW